MKAEDVKTIAMIGAGDMGHGIAATCLMGAIKSFSGTLNRNLWIRVLRALKAALTVSEKKAK